ncbi:MAG: phosphodiester glycosidase family protein [Candidatus Sericytochromatia bacterium]
MNFKKIVSLSITLLFISQSKVFSQDSFKDTDKTHNEWRYYFNGKDVSYLPELEIEGGTKYLPIEIVRQIGAILELDLKNRIAYITNNDETFVLKENSKEIYPNNPYYKLQEAPIWKNNTLYVPSNFLMRLNSSISIDKFKYELNVIKYFNSINEVKSNFDSIEGKIILNLDYLPIYETFFGKDYFKLSLYGATIREFDKVKKQLEDISSDFKKVEVDNSRQGIINITFYPKINFENTNVYYLEKPNRLVIQFPKIYHNEVREYVKQGLNISRISESDYQGNLKINILEINPRSSLTLKPMIYREGQNFGLKELSKFSKDFNALASINAGYFSTKTKFPLGLFYLNNNLLSAPIYNRTALVFNKNKTFDIKNIDLNIFLKSTDSQGSIKQLKINAFNQAPQKNQIVLFTYNYGKDNLNKKQNIKNQDEAMITTEEIEEYSGYIVSNSGSYLEKLQDFNSDIPQGKFVLYASGKGKEDLERISQNLSNYEINFNYSEDLSNVIHAIGGGPRLIKNNEINITSQQEKFQPDIAQGKAPRTAMAILKNGNILLMTVDGRQSSSRGMTLDELAYFLKDYEAKDAMNFDGGGSTAMYFNGSLINSVSDPKERKVSNGLFLFE